MYRLLARRWQSRLQAVLDEQRNGPSAAATVAAPTSPPRRPRRRAHSTRRPKPWRSPLVITPLRRLLRRLPRLRRRPRRRRRRWARRRRRRWRVRHRVRRPAARSMWRPTHTRSSLARDRRARLLCDHRTTPSTPLTSRLSCGTAASLYCASAVNLRY